MDNNQVGILPVAEELDGEKATFNSENWTQYYVTDTDNGAIESSSTVHAIKYHLSVQNHLNDSTYYEFAYKEVNTFETEMTNGELHNDVQEHDEVNLKDIEEFREQSGQSKNAAAVLEDPSTSFVKGIMNTNKERGSEKVKKSYICADCGYAAAQKGQLKRYKELIHLRGKNFKCDLCPHEPYFNCGRSLISQK